MKTLVEIALLVGALAILTALSVRIAAQQPAGGCAGCSQKAALPNDPADVVSARLIPGTAETMPVGRVENLIPIGVVAVLGCEKCAAEAVAWALQQGSSPGDVDRALRTVAAMRKLDCFNRTFGSDVASRMDKPLAAGRKALEQATTPEGSPRQ